jgi:hypothetical protein
LLEINVLLPKFMNASAEAMVLTNNLISVIRLQRHLGVRVIISTQEPTISAQLLDLSSVTIVHRFTSPEWLQSLKHHIAAVSISSKQPKGGQSDAEASQQETGDSFGRTATGTIFDRIVRLRVGEALLFAPSAVLGIKSTEEGVKTLDRLSDRYLQIRVRKRVTIDGGKSVRAE